MEGGSAQRTAPGTGATTARQPWPSSQAAYYGLAVIIIATMMNFFDITVFGLMAQRIKNEFQLTDEQLGLLNGPANIIFYVLIGIPLARLVDRYSRKIVLACGIAVIGGITALGGLAQTFAQLFMSRMLVGAGGSAHGPGAYSMLSDYFPPWKLPRAIGLLQLGFIGGTYLGLTVGGPLIFASDSWPVAHWLGLTIRGWHWVLLIAGSPGIVIAILLLLATEPRRRGVSGRPLSYRAVIHEIWSRRRIYLPLFVGLAMSATVSLGMLAWRQPFMVRQFGWDVQKAGPWMGQLFLISSSLGAIFGTIFVERLAKRYKDANVRASTILFAIAAPCEILSPMMPTAVLSLVFISIGGVCGFASAVPQNAAIQRITPNEMRGQVTAVYLFMFTVFGALGTQLIGTINTRVFGHDQDLWKSLALVAAVLAPLAAVAISFAIKPYGREVERLERLETAAE